MLVGGCRGTAELLGAAAHVGGAAASNSVGWQISPASIKRWGNELIADFLIVGVLIGCSNG